MITADRPRHRPLQLATCGPGCAVIVARAPEERYLCAEHAGKVREVLEPAQVRAMLAEVRGEVVIDPLPDSGALVTAPETSGTQAADASDGARGDSQAVAELVEGQPRKGTSLLAYAAAALVIVWVLVAILRAHHEDDAALSWLHSMDAEAQR